MPAIKQAPGDLELVRAFVNTRDIDERTEELSSARALVQWLFAHGLSDPGVRASRRDLERAIDLREALRTALLANNDAAPVPDGARAVIDQAADRARLMPRLDSDGESVLEPRSGGVDGALGGLLAIVHRSAAAGTWRRLKACRDETCQWAFYDHTKNRSGTWCSMADCGNRTKARAYRARRAHGFAPGGAGGVEKRAG